MPRRNRERYRDDCLWHTGAVADACSLHRLSLLGQSDEAYDGFAYGNLSMRRPEMGASFLISATQTGGLEHTAQNDWVLITECDLATFQVAAIGVKPPSSESVTHAMVYAADANITCVLHVHSHDIWSHAAALRLPTTGLRSTRTHLGEMKICVGNAITKYTYDAVGQLTRVTLPNNSFLETTRTHLGKIRQNKLASTGATSLNRL